MRAIGTGIFTFALALTAPAFGQTLTIVKVDGPAINCLFGAQCSIAPNDEFAEIALAVQRKAFLMSRTFVAGANTHASGNTAYQYRVDTGSAIPIGDSACVLNVTIDIGPISKLHYDPDLPAGDVYVITKGVPANQVGLLSAVKSGNNVTFSFDRPVCASTSGVNGDTSFFFGLASRSSPHGVKAEVDAAGSDNIPVKAFAPKHQ
jgi:hypothetical protein